MTELTNRETATSASAQTAANPLAEDELAANPVFRYFGTTARTKRTEKGAWGYRPEAIGNAFAEVFYRAGSFRQGLASEEKLSKSERNARLRGLRSQNCDILRAFIRGLVRANGHPESVYGPRLALLIRDVRGAGERSLGLILFRELLDRELLAPEDLVRVLGREGYGRWDDLLFLARETSNRKAGKVIEQLICAQLTEDDRLLAEQGKRASVSLLAKWMPSVSTSSTFSRREGFRYAKLLGLDRKGYRALLARLRRQLDVVEQKICAREWNRIDYEKVPGRAGFLYADQFDLHDRKRYREYRCAVLEGSARCHARTLTAPEILHPLLGLRCCADEAQWRVAEQLWRALPKPVIRGNVLAVCDVSTSMFRAVSVPRPVDVAVGLSLYLAEHNRGAFRNMVLTLEDGCTPLRFQPTDTLADRVSSLVRKSWSNADVGAVLAFLLRLCTENRVPPEDLPVLVFFSDMEFAGSAADHASKPVFDLWRERFHAARLPFPKVVFWNIGSRTQAVPMLESDAGVLLASGYSEKTLERLLAGDLAPRDPWEALKEVLDDPRYAAPFG